MTLDAQLCRLEQLGVPALAGLTPGAFRDLARALPDEPNTVLSVHPSLVSAPRLVPLLRRNEKPGFIVEDLTDLDEFSDLAFRAVVPNRPLYLLTDVDRGDHLRNRTPDEALPAIVDAGRTPLTITEGISWLLQDPDALRPNHCFMTIGSRKKVARGLDARTPAIWISGGTGRDGKVNAGAPKVGWCWAGNRHTWLGFAPPPRGAPEHPRSDAGGDRRLLGSRGPRG